MVEGSELDPLDTGGRVLLTREGLAGSPEVAGILLERAASAGVPAPQAGVLLIAHGMGVEAENQALLEDMEHGAEALRSAGYGEVRVATLREDWAEARSAAEQEIRAAVAEMHERGRRVVVIPYRLSGFGPYAGVLEGLEYVPTEGFLPHRLITTWITGRATSVLCSAGLASPLAPCDSVAAEPDPAPDP